MTETGKACIHALIRSAILLGFTLYILYLTEKGTLNYYIAPRMELYVKLAGLALYVLAVQQALHAYRTWRNRAITKTCDCSSTPAGGGWKHAAIYLFFLFPLMLGMFTPDTALGSKLADRKGINYAASSNLLNNKASFARGTTPEGQQPQVQQDSETASASITADNDRSQLSADHDNVPAEEEPNTNSNVSAGDTAPSESIADETLAQSEPPAGVTLSEEELEFLFPDSHALFAGYAQYARDVYNDEVIEVPEHSYTEVLTTLDLYKEQFIGKTIRISGFVYKPAELAEDQFAVSRYVMQCCSADASPYGVLSSYPRASSLSEDAWIEVTGTIKTTWLNETELLAIDVQQVRSIEEPSDPYVYPNFEFGL